MQRNTILFELRLMSWYLIRVAVIVICISATAWIAMRMSLYGMVDRNLERRMMGIQDAIHSSDPEGMRSELESYSRRVGFVWNFWVYYPDGTLFYQKQSVGPSVVPPFIRSEKIVYRNLSAQNENIRLAATTIHIGGRDMVVEWTDGLNLVHESLTTFTRLMLISMPILIVVGMLVTYPISRHALSALDWVIHDIVNIDPDNLSARLKVPDVDNQLRRLAETLNSMLDRIEGSMQKIRQFTADASHELRAPIALIRAATEYCLDGEHTHEELLSALARIERETEQTTQLLSDLLLLARADDRFNKFGKSSVDFTAATQEALERIASLSQSKSIKILADIPEATIWVDEGADPVERVVFILLDNAVKYTPQDGEIRVTLTAEPTAAVLEVADNGIGIAEDDIPRVFDRFWRADKSRSRQMRGTGLGLSIAKMIVEECGGTIRVESELGKGSRFIVRFPLIDTKDEASQLTSDTLRDYAVK